MTDQSFDFDFLARETLALTEQLRKKSLKELEDSEYSSSEPAQQIELDFFEDAFDFSTEEEKYEEQNYEEQVKPEIEEPEYNQENQEVQTSVVEGPGVVYKLEKGISTYCLRGYATDDMSWELDALERQDPQAMKKLRMNDEESIEDISFFSTHDEAFAETLVDQLVNRRFPRQEAIVCNISDPGFSWWLSCDELGFEVYFQSHGIERDENLIQLGPLGDPFIAYQFFKKSFSFLKSQFSINEFSATEKGLRVSCGQSSVGEFQKLVQLFIDGSFPWESDVFSSTKSMDKGLLLYFYELSLLRSFWVRVQDRLNH